MNRHLSDNPKHCAAQPWQPEDLVKPAEDHEGPAVGIDPDKPGTVRHTRSIKCPRCDALQIFSSRTALIDSCGFETYTLKCKPCGASLFALVDPADDQLLLTMIKG